MFCLLGAPDLGTCQNPKLIQKKWGTMTRLPNFGYSGFAKKGPTFRRKLFSTKVAFRENLPRNINPRMPALEACGYVLGSTDLQDP